MVNYQRVAEDIPWNKLLVYIIDPIYIKILIDVIVKNERKTLTLKAVTQTQYNDKHAI